MSSRALSALLLAPALAALGAFGCDGSSAAPDAGVSDASVSPDAAGDDASTPPLDDGGGPTPDGGSPDGGPPPPPLETSVCDADGVCDPIETCASCRADCGSCDVADLPSQRAKYVDASCPVMGDGLTDTCASGAGGPGRFNELQAALDSLEAGDTLHVHPGDYWRDVTGRDSGGIFTMDADGTPERPIVITARFRDDPPTIHSCDPGDLDRCPMAALAVYGDHAIVDHLTIRGRLQLWGSTGGRLQYLECTHGWGACGDGNWACLRIESCDGCVAHHNYVHDISGAGMGEACLEGTADFADRGAGLKEFQSQGTIWEFNTVTGAPVWGYDLHRNSENTTLRFNDFAAFPGIAIRVHRTRNLAVYGNVMVARDAEAGTCVRAWGRNERVDSEPHLVEIHHNTCIGAETGFTSTGELPTRLHDNLVEGLRDGMESPRNVVVESDASELSNNAYDGAGNYRRMTYESSTWSEDLAAWQAAHGWDAESVETTCELTTPPSGDGVPYDVRVTGGVCATLARDGGEVGAYGITNCVGHLCP